MSDEIICGPCLRGHHEEGCDSGYIFCDCCGGKAGVLHVATDPICALHVPPSPGLELAEFDRKRGVPCVACIAMSKPKRIQRKRTAGWRMPEGAVYVGRPSKWGNHYLFGDRRNASAAVALYRDMIERCAGGTRECVATDGLSVWDRHIVEHIRDELGGRDLACWCPLDQPCHADVLLELANGGTA